MALKNDAGRILGALKQVPGVASVTRGWPKQSAKLPCVLVGLAADVAEDYRDDEEYLTSLEYDVRIFSRTSDDSDAVSDGVDDAMRRLGYRRTLRYEDYGEDIRMVVLRYKQVF